MTKVANSYLSFLIPTMTFLAQVQTKSVCYKSLGCFSNSPPFDNAGAALPQSPTEIGTKFILYKPSAITGPGTELPYDSVLGIASSGIDLRHPIKILVHGFTGSEDNDWLIDMKNALLEKVKCNVIITGWKKGAAGPNYAAASSNTRVVGRQIVRLLQNLQTLTFDLKDAHIIGHSLGAQVAANAGLELNGKIGRISGLDPAAPLFEGLDPKVYLDSSDAMFVDILHSNGAPLWKLGLGFKSAVGHVDFYPNGGAKQPGCIINYMPPNSVHLPQNEAAVSESLIACSHGRSHTYYIESIRSKTCKFTAYGCPGGFNDFAAGKCSNCQQVGCSEMGYNSVKYPARGTMYLLTRDSQPFCSG